MNKKALNTSSACTVVLAISLLSVSTSLAQHRAVNLTLGAKRAP